jgi:hypothetical protein
VGAAESGEAQDKAAGIAGRAVQRLRVRWKPVGIECWRLAWAGMMHALTCRRILLSTVVRRGWGQQVAMLGWAGLGWAAACVE